LHKNNILFFAVPLKANTPASTSASSSSVTLQWDEVEGEGKLQRNYRIKWSPPDESGSSYTIVNNTNNATIDDLKGSSLYTFQVLSMNEGGNATEYSNSLSSPTSNMFFQVLLYLTNR